MGKSDDCHRTAFGRNQDYRAIEHCPRGAHPGTEQSAVRRCLMLGMVPGMLGRLRLSQTTDGQHTQHQHNRD